MITLGMTTCKRPDLACWTLRSFFENCHDKEYIQNVAIADDCSSDADVKQVLSVISQYHKGKLQIARKYTPGHAENVNTLFAMTETPYLIMLEDDWQMKYPGNIITEGMSILSKNPDILSVLYRRWHTGKDENGVLIHRQTGTEYDGTVNTWPGWTLNPSMYRIQELKKRVGLMENVPLFEYNYSKRYADAGFKMAMTGTDYFTHTGAKNSAYDLNKTTR